MTDVKITRGARRAVIWLLALVLVVGAGNLVATYLQVKPLRQASQKASAASQKAAVAAERAAAAEAAQVAACQAGNTVRAEQVDLWTFIIRISKPPKTADERQVLAEFEHHLRVVFAPRNCALPRPTGG